MKLRKVTLIDNVDFRSLPENFSIEFSKQDQNAIDPKCLVGVNGSGKSNLLELIAEIFYDIEINSLYNFKKKQKLFTYEIEYTIPMLVGDSHLTLEDDSFKIGDDCDVKIVKSNKRINFFIRSSSNKDGKYKEITENHETLLPNRIIGYSSGQNELLSNPFRKMRFHYIEKMRNMMNADVRYKIEKSRLFWMEYSNNNAIVLSTFLLGEDSDIEILTNELGISGIDSFKIIIDFSMSNRKIEPSKSMYNNIEKLKKCTPFWYEEKNNDDEVVKIVLDYIITKEVTDVFKHHFVTSQSLFEVLYQLELFNLYIHKKKLVDKILKDNDKSMNISEEVPFDPQHKVFDIKYLKLKKIIDPKKKFTKIIKYKNLSDGEHQFLQVFGSMMMFSGQKILFLLDEPETHFNPIWRSHMVTIINKIVKSKEEYAQDILLTTHSPFILSDSKQENIFKVYKKKGKVQVQSYKDSELITYGLSISELLDEFFGQASSIGNMSYEDIKQIISKIQTIDDYREAKIKLNKLGDSIEKFDAFNYLNRKRKELE